MRTCEVVPGNLYCACVIIINYYYCFIMADQGSLVAPAEAGIYSQPTGIFTDLEFLTAAKQVQNPILDDGWELFVECMGVKIHRKYKEVSFRFRVGGLCVIYYMKGIWSL